MQLSQKVKLVFGTSLLLTLANSTAVLAYPLDSSVFGPGGVCDEKTFQLDARRDTSDNRYSNGTVTDVIGDYHNSANSGNYTSSGSGVNILKQGRDCASARDWYSTERKRDRKHQRNESRRDRQHAMTNGLVNTGVNLLSGLFQHSQNRRAEQRAAEAEQRAMRTMEQQAQEIEALKALVQQQNSMHYNNAHQYTQAPIVQPARQSGNTMRVNSPNMQSVHNRPQPYPQLQYTNQYNMPYTNQQTTH